MDANENSGTLEIVTVGPEPSRLDVVWERRRLGSLRIKARAMIGFPEDPQALLDEVDRCCRSRLTTEFYGPGQLRYEGLAWRGELWLSDSLRLGAPSKIDETASLGPRVILVDAQLAAIDFMDANASLTILLREIAVFLSIVLRRYVRVESNEGRTWIQPPFGVIATSNIAQLGYVEGHARSEMPKREMLPFVPTTPIVRPNLKEPMGIGLENELRVPADLCDLWTAFVQLSPDARRDFIQAGTLLQLAYFVQADYRTAGVALMTAACEALKPGDSAYRDHNAYDVIEALLGAETVAALRQQRYQPIDVRNALFHRGELHADEFKRIQMLSTFEDPSFDEMRRLMWRIASEALIAWLLRGGRIELGRRRRDGQKPGKIWS